MEAIQRQEKRLEESPGNKQAQRLLANAHKRLWRAAEAIRGGDQQIEIERPDGSIKVEGGNSGPGPRSRNPMRNFGKAIEHRMAKVGEELSVPPVIGAAEKNIVLSFGLFSRLNEIKTHDKSRSAMNVLWRQLEFGSGMFAKAAGNQLDIGGSPGTTIPRTINSRGKQKDEANDGSWTLQGFHVLGTYPGNWLRRQTGLPYTEDALRFQKQVAKQLQARLGA
jgi:hypothetical protein